MNYITFDQGILNLLVASEIKNSFQIMFDYSIFQVKHTNPLHYVYNQKGIHMNFQFDEAAYKKFLNDDFTILYSFCPFELCGLYATVSFLQDSDTNVYISRPPYNEQKPDAINYGDLTPEEAISSLKNPSLLSRADRQQMHEEWTAIAQEGTNLRIWKDEALTSVADDYFDDDIKTCMERTLLNSHPDVTFTVQHHIRSKYHIGLNPRFIKWRTQTIRQKNPQA